MDWFVGLVRMKDRLFDEFASIASPQCAVSFYHSHHFGWWRKRDKCDDRSHIISQLSHLGRLWYNTRSLPSYHNAHICMARMVTRLDPGCTSCPWLRGQKEDAGVLGWENTLFKLTKRFSVGIQSRESKQWWIISAKMELEEGFTTLGCVGEVLVGGEREKGLAEKEEQQLGEALASLHLSKSSPTGHKSHQQPCSTCWGHRGRMVCFCQPRRPAHGWLWGTNWQLASLQQSMRWKQQGGEQEETWWQQQNWSGSAEVWEKPTNCWGPKLLSWGPLTWQPALSSCHPVQPGRYQF